MSQKRLLVGILILVMSLSACDNGNAGASQECLLGTWEIEDMEAYGRVSILPGSFDQDDLGFNRAAGELSYEFMSNGQLVIRASKWATRFQVTDEQSISYLDLIIDGSVESEYRVDGETVIVETVENGDLSFLATMEGEVMMYTRNPDEFAPLLVSNYNSAEFECSVDTLSLRVFNHPWDERPMTFTRMK